MEEKFNKPERGGMPGVYKITNLEGETVELIAEVHPQADAYIRMGAKYVKSIEDWRAEQLTKRAEELKAKEQLAETSDKKGKK